MATKKEIIEELEALEFEVEGGEDDYTHSELMQMLKDAKEYVAQNDSDSPGNTEENDDAGDEAETVSQDGDTETVEDPADQANNQPGDGDSEDGSDDESKKTDESAEKPKTPEYAFLTKARCPRCNGTQTKAYATKGKVQYRKCTAPVCQEKFTVIGKKV